MGAKDVSKCSMYSRDYVYDLHAKVGKITQNRWEGNNAV